MSPRKIAFFAIAAVLIVLVGIGFIFLGNGKGKKDAAPVQNLTVWLVGEDSAGYSDIVTGFKSRNEKYANLNINFVKFANYTDYEKVLLNVIADGNSPDIFQIPSDGSLVLESKTEELSSDYFSADEFSKNFLRIFDDLLVSRDGEDESGQKIIQYSLKWVPMSYEAPAVFYNRDLVSNAVPRTWTELAQSIPSAGGASPDGVLPPSDFTLAGIGLGGTYVQGAADIMTLMFAQNGIRSYSDFSKTNASGILTQYLSYGTPASGGNYISNAPIPSPNISSDDGSGSDASGATRPVISNNSTILIPGASNGNDLTKNIDEMKRLGLTATDLFARGKVGFVIGYPSYLREIQYAIKRAGNESVFNKKNLKTTNIPVNDGDKAYNLARYNYFTLSKTAQNSEIAKDFLSYLLTKTAQETYLSRFPYALPAMSDLQETRKKQILEKEYPWVKYESFLPSAGIELITFQKGLLSEYNTYFNRILDSGKTDAANILKKASDMIDCNKRHLVEWKNFEEDCSISN